MLVYHPIYDSYHCIFRILCILHDIQQVDIEVDLIRILDFYVLFPSRLKNIKLPQAYISYKKIFKQIPDPYENLPIDIKLLDSLKEIQNIAIKTLAAQNIIDKQTYLEKNKIIFFHKNISQNISSIILNSKIRQQDWSSVLIENISLIKFYGSNGLKDRTSLLEYQYDSV